MTTAADTSGPDTGISLDEAASAFDAILTGGAADTQEGGEALQGAQNGAPATPDTDDDLRLLDDDGEGQPEGEETTEEGEQEPDRTAKVRVKVDGQEIEVTLDELTKGYLRQSDYTRKTQEAAEQRKAADAELQQVRAERAQYAQTLQQLHAVLSAQMPQVPDWQKLANEDPASYVRQRAQWDALQQQRAAVAAEHERVTQQTLAEQATQLRQTVDEQRKLIADRIPEWKDPEKAASEQKALIDYGRRLGFTDAELGAVFNARQVEVLRKAWKFDQLMERKAELKQGKPAQPAPAAVKPGPTQMGRTGVSELTRAKQRLAKTGDVRDAAAVFEKFL